MPQAVAGDTDAPDPTAASDGADDEPVPDVPPAPAEDGAAFVRFDLGAAPLALGAVPYPSEAYRDAEGRIALGEIPNPQSDSAMWAATRELLAGRDGFCTTCNAVFVIDGGLDATSLPDPAAMPRLDDAVVVIDVDPTSAEHGRAFPVRTQYDEDSGWLSVRPARGFSLAAHTRYAVVVTDAARGADGLALSVPEPFAAIRDGVADATTPAAYEDALVELDALGLPRDRVRGLAPFRTGDPGADLRAIRTALADAPAPTATVDAVIDGAGLDDLLGIPAEDGPGVDLEPAADIEGTTAVAHATTELVVAGTLSAPRFVAGEGTEIGAPRRDDAGAPTPRPGR